MSNLRCVCVGVGVCVCVCVYVCARVCVCVCFAKLVCCSLGLQFLWLHSLHVDWFQQAGKC